ncbi:MAG: hypothetical protein LBU88_03565 [Treponema sp.]|nr:hypothetical protein [Treponema sp.]
MTERNTQKGQKTKEFDKTPLTMINWKSGSPFSVLRSPFSVLRSPFSVLRSPFSV